MRACPWSPFLLCHRLKWPYVETLPIPSSQICFFFSWIYFMWLNLSLPSLNWTCSLTFWSPQLSTFHRFICLLSAYCSTQDLTRPTVMALARLGAVTGQRGLSGVWTTEIHFSVFEAGSQRSGCHHGWVYCASSTLQRLSFLYLHTVERGLARSLASSCTGTSSIHERSTSWPRYFPEAPPPNTTTLALEFQHRNLGENTNIPSNLPGCPIFIQILSPLTSVMPLSSC